MKRVFFALLALLVASTAFAGDKIVTRTVVKQKRVLVGVTPSGAVIYGTVTDPCDTPVQTQTIVTQVPVQTQTIVTQNYGALSGFVGSTVVIRDQNHHLNGRSVSNLEVRQHNGLTGFGFRALGAQQSRSRQNIKIEIRQRSR